MKSLIKIGGVLIVIILISTYVVLLCSCFSNTSKNKIEHSISSIYGIQIDNNTGICTRIKDAKQMKNDYAVGETFKLNGGNNDFDSAYPWREVKLCNVNSENGELKITYSNNELFTRDGSNGDVCVEIPKFYSQRKVKDNIETICISGALHPGFILEDAFYDSVTGKVRDHIYIGAYTAGINENNELTSISNIVPNTCNNLLYYREKGEIYDYAMLSMLQKLISIEFGAVNMSQFFGGISYIPFHGDVKAYESSDTPTNNGMFIEETAGGSSGLDNLIEGYSVTISEEMSNLADRKILELGKTKRQIIDGKEYHIRKVVFSGEPVCITKGKTLLYCSAQKTGLTDELSYHTSRCIGENTAVQFKYRDIEGIWGNIGQYVDGLILKDLRYYYSYLRNDYNDIDKYAKLSYSSVEQNQYNFYFSFITRMGYDVNYPNINLPDRISSDGSGKDYEFYGDILCANYLYGPDGVTTGQKYDEGTQFVCISSMAWDGKSRNGLYMIRFWTTATDGASWLYGTRKIYRSN